MNSGERSGVQLSTVFNGNWTKVAAASAMQVADLLNLSSIVTVHFRVPSVTPVATTLLHYVHAYVKNLFRKILSNLYRSNAICKIMAKKLSHPSHMIAYFPPSSCFVVYGLPVLCMGVAIMLQRLYT